MQATTHKTFRVHGTTDDVTECGLCGREELKSTIILIELDANGNDLEAHYYGSDCGAKAAGWTQKNFKAKLKAADADRQRERAAQRAKRHAERTLREATAFATWATDTYGVTVTARPEWGNKLRNNDVFDALNALKLEDDKGRRRTGFSFLHEFIGAVPANRR